MLGKKYDPEIHLEDCLTTWRDAGWLDKGRERTAAEFFEKSSGLVGEVDGKAKALVLSNNGDFRHRLHDELLPFCSVSSVTVAFEARKEGLASRLTAEILARAAEKGQVCAGLGMFEQGFYDRLGFSNMPYWRSCFLRPSEITLSGKMSSKPVRLGSDHWKEIHESRVKRIRRHGSVSLEYIHTKSELEFQSKGFVLGFRNTDGELTHHVHFTSIRNENGPAFTGWLAYRDRTQFRDLMLLLKSMGNQIDLVRITEPAGIQLQTLLSKPIAVRRKSLGAPTSRAELVGLAWTQSRILDLAGCLNGMNCPGPPCSFSLALYDPVEQFLDSSTEWLGCAGEYTIHLDGDTRVKTGRTKGLEVMKCSVNTFTKIWNGTLRPTMAPYTENITASPDLLERIERAMPLPEPAFDWEL